MGKLPAFQFYPADWLNNIKLQSCSMAAQGLFINMICIMHQSEKYGYLLVNGLKPSSKVTQKLLRIDSKNAQRVYKKLTGELVDFGVLKITDGGIFYCERMVKDEHIRKVRREAGLKGGNPDLKLGKPNPYYLDKQKDNQKITPSSSSSSSSSLKEKEYKEKEIYNFYKTEINPSRKSSTRAKENIKYYLKKYSKEQLLETIKNYKLICGDDPEFKKDPANFFGKKDKYFIDCLSENFELQKKEDDDPWEGRL